MDGSKLVAVGEDAYRIEGNSSYIKFVQKDNNLYYSPKEYYTSCIRVPWNEGTQWQLFVILSFIAISLIGFIVATVRTISGTIKKKGKYPILINLPYIVVFIIFLSMIIRFIYHLCYMNNVFGGLNCTAGLEGVISFFKVAASMMLIFGLGGIVSTVFLWLKKRNIIVCIFYSIWSLVIILFTLWLIQMNLIG